MTNVFINNKQSTRSTSKNVELFNSIVNIFGIFFMERYIQNKKMSIIQLFHDM